MKTKIQIEREDITLTIETTDVVTWKEIMCTFVDALKGMGYHSDEFEELEERFRE